MFSQEEYSPEDPANPCVNYPTEQYESFADCDEQFVRRSLPPGLKPFWTVDNISEATNTFDLEYELYNKTYDYFGRYLCSIQCIKKVVRMAITVSAIAFIPPIQPQPFLCLSGSAYVMSKENVKLIYIKNNQSF